MRQGPLLYANLSVTAGMFSLCNQLKQIALVFSSDAAAFGVGLGLRVASGSLEEQC